LTILSDGARQYDVLVHAACWLHAERPLARMIPYSDKHQAAIAKVRGQIWELYQDLKKYRQRPEPSRRPDLEARFDFWAYLQDRVRGVGQIPRLADLIRQKAEEMPARKAVAASQA